MKTNFIRNETTGELTRLRFWPADIIEAPMHHHKMGLSYTASGYGDKIPTQHMVKMGSRLYRVYCRIFSNVGTCYIQCKEGRYIVDFQE